MFYSPSSNGFYSAEIHGDGIPWDAVPISREEHRTLLAGQCAGMKIVADEHGVPKLVDPWAGRHKEYFALLIAARRYACETGGIEFDGMRFETARDARTALVELNLAALRNPAFRCRWKGSAGFISLDGKMLQALGEAICRHVQSCFDREAQLLAHLEAGTFTESMLDEGWPA